VESVWHAQQNAKVVTMPILAKYAQRVTSDNLQILSTSPTSQSTNVSNVIPTALPAPFIKADVYRALQAWCYEESDVFRLTQ